MNRFKLVVLLVDFLFITLINFISPLQLYYIINLNKIFQKYSLSLKDVLVSSYLI